MASRVLDYTAYTTKELSKKTWPDFERLFSKGGGWNFCWCVHFHRPGGLPKNKWLRTRAERSVRNHREKRELVEKGCSHGILVYARGKPVGWCQYGPSEELPRIDNSRNYRGLAPKATDRLWRITCFVVDKEYRRRGVATAALKAALEAIRSKGGGLVEAYPIPRWEDLRRSELRRRGRAPAFGNVSTHGTVPMFEKEGFKAIAPFGSINVLMRRSV
jgi:GNAT superfamily N-acetyltransferase